MPSSGYVADTFVAGEQPTTSKWNELWGNDASFNSGAGFNDAIIANRHIAANAVNYSQLLATIFSSQVVTDTNPGSGAGTRNFLNLGGVKLLWGTTSAQSLVSNANVTLAVTFGTTFTTTPVMVAVPFLPPDNRVSAVVQALNTSAGNVLLQSNGSATNNVAAAWYVIGV